MLPCNDDIITYTIKDKIQCDRMKSANNLTSNLISRRTGDETRPKSSLKEYEIET